MTEIERLLLESLKKLTDESEQRERRLAQQLTVVEAQLKTLSGRVEVLTRQVNSLSAELEK